MECGHGLGSLTYEEKTSASRRQPMIVRQRQEFEQLRIEVRGILDGAHVSGMLEDAEL